MVWAGTWAMVVYTRFVAIIWCLGNQKSQVPSDPYFGLGLAGSAHDFVASITVTLGRMDLWPEIFYRIVAWAGFGFVDDGPTIAVLFSTNANGFGDKFCGLERLRSVYSRFSGTQQH